MLTPEEIRSYLNRLGIDKIQRPSLAFLQELQAQHLFAIPFENRAVHAKNPIQMEAAVTKIIQQQGGGICYELNWSFFQLLAGLGYEEQLLEARVWEENKGWGAPFDHLALLVQVAEESYLVDVGFGEFAQHPIPLQQGNCIDPRGVFEVDFLSPDFLQINLLKDDVAVPQYQLNLQPQPLEAFFPMLNYHQTNPASTLVNTFICSLLRPNKGRIRIVNDEFRISTAETLERIPIDSSQHRHEIMKTWFGMDLDSSI